MAFWNKRKHDLVSVRMAINIWLFINVAIPCADNLIPPQVFVSKLAASLLSFSTDLHLFRVAYLLVILVQQKSHLDAVTQGYFSKALVKCCKSILKQLLSHWIRFLCKAAHQLLFSITAICQVQDQIRCKAFALHNVWSWSQFGQLSLVKGSRSYVCLSFDLLFFPSLSFFGS